MPGRRSLLVTSSAALLGASPLSKHSAVAAFEPALLQQATGHAAGLDQLQGLIVARHGRIAVGEAFRGPGLGRPINVKSVSTTLVASLAGAAIDRALLQSVGQRLGSLLADLVPAGADPRVREITVAHLLTMQAGLERTSGPNYARWITRPFRLKKLAVSRC
jgi:CubicO group peptidase (beta-lactamase class C family)